MTIQLRPRHPEKAHSAPTASSRASPNGSARKRSKAAEYYETRRLMRDHDLATVCEEAACPNIGECWSKRHATMMIMGEICTRGCSFCNVTHRQAGPAGRVSSRAAWLQAVAKAGPATMS